MTDGKAFLRVIARGRVAPIGVVGDFMLDEYVLGTVTRISPESPVPIVEHQSRYSRPSPPAGRGELAVRESVIAKSSLNGDRNANNLKGKPLSQYRYYAGEPWLARRSPGKVYDYVMSSIAMKPLAAILVPDYNAQEWIAQSIQSELPNVATKGVHRQAADAGRKGSGAAA
jgi:hypothetical protein